ncbi:MAG: 5'-deoxynucleotidase [Eubacteriales bacterium]|nr:5'-deoxynucleotidase [Clostridiales bacterium]MDD7393020.1 5'-deoxynucleotidase [Eubacteriales bacterium]MDY3760990.1 5'-deoxynucleotidase [Eubacteriales bacterium]
MYHFYAVINRMKYINRWGLMRNTERENLQEHSFQVAVLAHALALIEKERFGADVDPDRAAVIALFHDASEIITGDMPTPVKYYNDGIRSVYKEIEKDANALLVEKLPEDLRREYSDLLSGEDRPEYKFVKAADTISAYIKCVEELKAGNREFEGAAKSIREKLDNIQLKSVRVFTDEFLGSFSLTLDEQS